MALTYLFSDLLLLFISFDSISTALGVESPLSPPSINNTGLTPLNVYFSSSRDDHFVTTTSCDECVGLYDFVGVTGYVYGAANAVANVPLTTYYNSDLTDNILLAGSTQPPAGYGFVRIEVLKLLETLNKINEGNAV